MSILFKAKESEKWDCAAPCMNINSRFFKHRSFLRSEVDHRRSGTLDFGHFRVVAGSPHVMRIGLARLTFHIPLHLERKVLNLLPPAVSQHTYKHSLSVCIHSLVWCCELNPPTRYFLSNRPAPCAILPASTQFSCICQDRGILLSPSSQLFA